MSVLVSARNVLDLFRLDGKKALVTGGAQGIGRGFSLALAGAGADVAIVDINEKTGRSVVEEVKALGRDSIFVDCDVSKKDQVDRMVDTVVERFGRLDIGVNNAGLPSPRVSDGKGGWRRVPDEELSKEDWDKMTGVNYTGVFLCCQAEGRVMIKQRRGKIINTASISATIVNACIAYGASKAGVVMMTKRLAAEWGKYNINVNCISPSYTLSPMHAISPERWRNKVREMTPMGWFESTEDLYGAVVFLASDASNYITGVDLMVDGGHTLNVWMEPIKREALPLVSRDEEVVQLVHDLEVKGIKHKKGFVAL